MKRSEEIVEILEAYDLTGSYRAAAELAGCDHHTVARYVALREAGQPPVAREHRARPIDDYLDKIEELVARSNGRVRADVVHQRLVAMGFGGGERTTRRVVAEVKARLRAGQRRVFRPWVTEPGLWLQWDWGEGPRVGGRRTNLWCAWLAWSRFRVVIAVWDRTLPTIVACLDTTLRRLGGVPTYALTDNERTVSVDHVAGVAVRHPEIVAVGRHYGMSHPHLRARRSAVQGWVGGDRADRQGRPRPDRGQPGRGVSGVRAARSRLPELVRAGQRPTAPGDPPPAD